MFRNLIRTRWFKYISPYIFMPYTTKPWRISRGSWRRILKGGKRKANWLELEEQQGGRASYIPTQQKSGQACLFLTTSQQGKTVQTDSFLAQVEGKSWSQCKVNQWHWPVGSAILRTLISQGKHISSMLHGRLPVPTGRCWAVSQEALGRVGSRDPATRVWSVILSVQGQTWDSSFHRESLGGQKYWHRGNITPGLGKLFISKGLRR